ncbi:MAG: SBBP repeat-containing protein [Desulfuromonadales bacterium]|nr:SBBP repeat-containing protein [Desulfuromonadales bacterium]
MCRIVRSFWGGVTVLPNTVALENMANGTVSLLPYGPFLDGVRITAYHRLADGDQLFAFDTTQTFADDFVVRPGDVVRFGRLLDPFTGEESVLYTLEFEAVDAGLPDGVMVDALTVAADGNLLLSFDTTVTLGGSTFGPQDLVRYDGATFSMALNSATAGVPAGLNLDGAQLLPSGHLLLSFDGSGTIAGVAFDDEDILEYDPAGGSWEMAYDGSDHFESWIAADLGAFFVVPSASIPTVTTAVITSITSASATSGGNVTSDGGSAINARGVCWGLTVNPDTSGSCSSESPGAGVFISAITNLTSNSLYHVRAYATNAAGTSYGSDLQFTTALGLPTLIASISTVTTTTAASGGYVYSDGGATVTARGICWSTSPSPALGGTCGSAVSGGTGTFVVDTITGLQPNTTYYLRAYATNSVGTAYSPALIVGTLSFPGQDPLYAWHTFYGNYPTGDGVATDANGNVYITGHSTATWTGPNGEQPRHPLTGSDDLFVVKLDSSGVYQWHTFYRTTTPNYRYGIAVDSDGNSYLTGASDTSWTGPSGQPPLHAFSSGSNILVLKLDTSGAYQWHTFFGDSNNSQGFGIAVNGVGDLYVSGYSYTTWTGPNGAPPVSNFGSASYAAFVLKLNVDGVYRWHSFHGSNTSGHLIALPADGTVYVSGNDGSGVWTGDIQAPRNPHSGQGDGFVLKLDSDGGYLWHTFYGSGGYDTGDGLAADSLSNVYITGRSDAAWTGPGGVQPLNSYSNGSNIYALKLDSNGNYQWHSFYGTGSCYNNGFGVLVDSGNNVYLGGVACLPWNGPEDQSPIRAFDGTSDAFVLKLSETGGYQWHTFYGPGNIGIGFALDSANNIYATGYSSCVWNGPAGQAPLHADGNTFVLKLAQPGLPTVTTAAVTGVGAFTATSGGTVSGAGVTSRGVCWGTLPDPVVGGNCTGDGSGTGTFASVISGLSPNTVYHVRAFATNLTGTAYGEDLNISTCGGIPSGSVSWWRGEGNYNDQSGTHNATPVNGVSFLPGKVGQAFSFNGQNQYLALPGTTVQGSASWTVQS